MIAFCMSGNLIVAQTLPEIFIIAIDFNEEFTQVRLVDALAVKLETQCFKRFQIPAQTPDQKRFFIFRCFRHGARRYCAAR